MLYSYVIPNDSGCAPNPFGGVCTLVICKPRIREQAQPGDWIVGTGAATAPIEGVEGKMVYAMLVTQKMTMREYDAWAQHHCTEKIPDRRSSDPWRGAGDAIYDYREDPPRIRKGGPHGSIAERTHDLGGKYALLSNHFFYFGDQPIDLPEYLRPIVKKGPGHRGPSNDPYLETFVEWIAGLGLEPCGLYGKPQIPLVPSFVPEADLFRNPKKVR